MLDDGNSSKIRWLSSITVLPQRKSDVVITVGECTASAKIIMDTKDEINVPIALSAFRDKNYGLQQ